MNFHFTHSFACLLVCLVQLLFDLIWRTHTYRRDALQLHVLFILFDTDSAHHLIQLFFSSFTLTVMCVDAALVIVVVVVLFC